MPEFIYLSFREAILLPVICAITSIYGGFAIFAAIGHMAHSLNSTDVQGFMTSGPGLIFIVYPEALTRLPGASIWAILFFLTLIFLALDSQVSSSQRRDAIMLLYIYVHIKYTLLQPSRVP